MHDYSRNMKDGKVIFNLNGKASIGWDHSYRWRKSTRGKLLGSSSKDTFNKNIIQISTMITMTRTNDYGSVCEQVHGTITKLQVSQWQEDKYPSFLKHVVSILQEWDWIWWV